MAAEAQATDLLLSDNAGSWTVNMSPLKKTLTLEGLSFVCQPPIP